MNLTSQYTTQALEEVGRAAEARQAEIEANRCIPDDLMLQLKETGILHTWTAIAYGGKQAHVLSLVSAIQQLAYYNGSIAWIVGVTGTAALGSGYLQPEVAQEVFGHSMAQVGGWAVPAAMAQAVDGGLLVSGKWAWGSGIRHCTHIVGGVIAVDEENKPKSALVYMDPKDVAFIDNWQVLGLRGSNSIDYSVKNLFIPNGKWVWFPSSEAVVDAPLYRFSFLGALASGVAGVALGLAHRALDEIKNLSKKKRPMGARKTLAERPVIHDKIARMEAAYYAAKLFLESSIKESWAAAEERKQTAAQKSKLRLAAANAVEASAQVVRDAYQIGGGSSIWDGVKLQELFRDVNAITQHGLVASSIFEVVGRVSMGQKVNEALL